MPSSRARVNRYHSHLVIDAVTEGDEGTYTVKNPNKPEDVRRMVLVVRGTGGSPNSFSFDVIKLFLCDFPDVRPQEVSTQAQFINVSAACLFVGLLMSPQAFSKQQLFLLGSNQSVHPRYDALFQTTSCLQLFHPLFDLHKLGCLRTGTTQTCSGCLNSSTSRNVRTTKDNVKCSEVVKMLPCV